MSEELAIPGTLSETGLDLPQNLSRERWLEIGQTLRRMEKSIQFWVGDWYAYGERQFGEEAAQGLGWSERTLDNYASVCRRVPASRRRESLSFSHHEAVASLEPAQQEQWLEEAAPVNGDERPRLSTKELRESVRTADHGPAEVMQTKLCEACNGAGRVPVEDGGRGA